MSKLLIGFDSAWTASKSGAIVGAFCSDDGTLRALGLPQTANYREAAAVILGWQAELCPTTTIVLLDQPTIVKNETGQRPVENIVSPSVCRRYGGMQPANTARHEMFGRDAPVWPFLEQFGGVADPLNPVATGGQVFETYPVLAMLALGWTLPDSRPSGRLPKYNPERKKTFTLEDWRYLCTQLSGQFRERGLTEIVEWLDEAGRKPSPRKRDQDCLDACLCLLVALYLVEQRDCLMVGDQQTGYIIVPDSVELRREFETRCTLSGRLSPAWVRTFRSVMPITERSLVSFDFPEALEILERTPAVVGSLLRGTSAGWHDASEGPDTWSAYDVVGHLIHGEETDWVPRARIILEHGAERPFEPFDRFAQFTRFAGWPLDRLLDRFAELRQANLETVKGWRLTDAQLALPGRHPELGAVTLQQLLATWVVHDLNHIAQIARVMARRYTEDVGAWRAYLSILNR